MGDVEGVGDGVGQGPVAKSNGEYEGPVAKRNCAFALES